MSLLIKKLEMPTEGELLCINIYPDGKVCINLDLDCKQVGTAVPVPPHGRLIDADAFIKQKTEQICENCDRRRGMKDGKLTKRFVYAIGDAPCRACDTGDMLDYVDEAPTIIEAEEVYNKYTDTAGNLHWTGTRSGEHTIRAEEGKK